MRKRSGRLLANAARPHGEDPDAYVLKLVGDRPNLLVPHFLMHSWLYYVKDQPLVSDACFEEIVKGLESRWEQIAHVHKKLIDPGLLKTGFYLSYPDRVKHAAVALCALFGKELTC